MTNKISTTLRLMMTTEPKEQDIKYKNKDGNEMSRVRESLEAFLLGTGVPLTVIDLNINKFVNGSQYRNVKIGDLYKMFAKNEAELKSGKKVLLAHVELLPQKNNFNDSGVINAFQPYLTGYDIADATEEDLFEVEAIRRIVG